MQVSSKLDILKYFQRYHLEVISQTDHIRLIKYTWFWSSIKLIEVRRQYYRSGPIRGVFKNIEWVLHGSVCEDKNPCHNEDLRRENTSYKVIHQHAGTLTQLELTCNAKTTITERMPGMLNWIISTKKVLAQYIQNDTPDSLNWLRILNWNIK